MSNKHPKSQTPTQPPAPGNARKAIAVGLVAVAAVALFAFVLLRGGASAPDSQAGGPERAAALASTNSPTHGEATAPVHIVEFLDPACETCASFYSIMKELMQQNPGRIRLSIRHVAFHDGSEFPVRVLEASRRQDKYWETLEMLFGRQAQWAPNHTVQPDLVLQTVSAVGLDLARLMTDMNSPEVGQRMAQDMADAATLKVTATPEYFVNGRPLPEFGESQLRALVQEELDRAR